MPSNNDISQSLSLRAVIKSTVSLSFVYTVNIARLFLPPLFPQFLSSSSSRVSDITIVISFPNSTSLKRVICQKFGKVLEPKHSQLLRNTRRSSLEDGIAPFFPRSDYNRCSFQIGGDDSQGYRTRAFPSRFLAIKVPPIYLSFQSFFFFFSTHRLFLPSSLFFPSALFAVQLSVPPELGQTANTITAFQRRATRRGEASLLLLNGY